LDETFTDKDSEDDENTARAQEVADCEALRGEDDRVGGVGGGQHEGEGAGDGRGEQQQQRVREPRLRGCHSKSNLVEPPV